MTCHLSSHQDLEAVQRPRLRDEEEPDPRALRHRRWQRPSPRRGRPRRRHLLRTSSGLSASMPHPGRQLGRARHQRCAVAQAHARRMRATYHPAPRASATSSPPTDLVKRQALRARASSKQGTGPTSSPSCKLRAHTAPAPMSASAIVHATTSVPHLVDQGRPPGSVSGPRPTTSSWPTHRTDASWLNRIEAQFTALQLLLPSTEPTTESHSRPRAFLIRRYIAWRNRHAQDEALRELVKRANVA